MNRKKRFTPPALGWLALWGIAAACSADYPEADGSTFTPMPVEVTAEVGSGGATRATDQTWKVDDQVGIIALDDSGTTPEMLAAYRNVGYKASVANSTGSFQPIDAANTLYIHNRNSKAKFCAYYPYKPSTDNRPSTLPGTDGKITINTACQTISDQWGYDYLYATGATVSASSPTLAFKGGEAFKHRMSRLFINFKAGAGISETDLQKAKFYLNGLKHDGKFDALSGNCEATGSVMDVWNLQNIRPDAAKTEFRAIVLPQTATLVFKIEIEQKTYQLTLSGKELKAGYSYTFTVTVREAGLNLSVVDNGMTWKDEGNKGSLEPWL